MNKNQDKFRITLFVLLGLILGGILGEFLGWTLGTLGELTGAGADNTVRSTRNLKTKSYLRTIINPMISVVFEEFPGL